MKVSSKIPKDYILLPVKTETLETLQVKEYVDILPGEKQKEALEETYDYRISRIKKDFILAYYSLEDNPNKTLIKLSTGIDIEVNISQETIDQLINIKNNNIFNLWGIL